MWGIIGQVQGRSKGEKEGEGGDQSKLWWGVEARLWGVARGGTS